MSKMRFTRGIVSIMGMLLCMSLLSGCGQDENAGTMQPEIETAGSAPGRVSVLEGRQPYDLMSQPWQAQQEPVPAAIYWNQTTYMEKLVQDPPEMSSGAKRRAVEGKDYYILATYTTYVAGRQEPLYYLNHLDGDTLETECHQLYLEELGDAERDINSLDVSEGVPIVFLYRYDQEKQLLAEYYAVWVDAEGHVERRQDLLPALQAAGLVREGEYLASDTARWDSQGYYCVRGATQDELYAVIDEEGGLVTVLDPLQGQENAIVSLYQDSQGRCIWEIACAVEQSDRFWGIKEGRQAELYTGKYQVARGRLFNAYGDLYYVDGRDNLVRWDASTGKSEILYEGNGGSFKEYYAAAQDSEGNILLFYDNGRDYLFRIANEDVEQVELTVAGFGYAIYGIRAFTAEYNRLHPNVRIVIQGEIKGDSENEWLRMQADMVAGKGPDLLVADRAQIEVLQKKGMLADLSQVLEQETLEELFPGVLEYGRIDGGLYSICYTTAGSTIMVSRERWAGDTWTWEDVLKLLQEQEKTGEPFMSVSNSSESGLHLLDDFFLADLENCSLLDLEGRRAYFDTDAFCSLLEACKRYTGGEGNRYTDEEQARKRLKQGEILCYEPSALGSGLMWFSADLADLGEEYHLVGYPTESGNGNLLRCNEGLAVNASTKHPELAAELVNFVVSQSYQELYDLPVRSDAYTRRIREHIDYQRADGKPIIFVKNGKYSVEVDGKPDGTSYLPEYLAYMESCRPLSGVTEPIRDIILEEAEAFFSGDKDARTAAGIIQSRVQLYLDENS